MILPNGQEGMNNFFESAEWSSAHTNEVTQALVPEILRLGDSTIDRHSGRVKSPHGEQRLRAKELDLLASLPPPDRDLYA